MDLREVFRLLDKEIARAKNIANTNLEELDPEKHDVDFLTDQIIKKRHFLEGLEFFREVLLHETMGEGTYDLRGNNDTTRSCKNR